VLVSERVMDALKGIGLNLYERKLWVALLSRGVSTAGELADLAKVPRSRAYDVLQSLAEKGFVVVQSGRPLRYVAIPPKEALENAKRRILQRAEEMARKIDEMKESDIMKELEGVFERGINYVNPGDLTGAIKGRHLLYTQLENLFRNAKKYISLFAPSEILRELHDLHGDLLRALAKKGVSIRILTDKNVDKELANRLKETGEVKKVEIDKELPRFCLVDGKHVVLALTDHKTHPTQDSAIWAQSEHAAAMFEHVFENLWSSAKSV